MNRKELESMWANMLRAERLTEAQLDRLAAAVVEVHQSGASGFRQHIKNRLEQIGDRIGATFEQKNFDLPTARTFPSQIPCDILR